MKDVHSEGVKVQVPAGCSGGEAVAIPHRGKEIQVMLPFNVAPGQTVVIQVATDTPPLTEDPTIPNDAPELVKVYCDMTVRRPAMVCGGCCSCIFLLVFLAVALQWPLMSEPGQEDWIVADSTLSEQFDALSDAEKQVIGEVSVSFEDIRKKRFTFSSLSFLYTFKDNDDKNIFTPESVQAMCKVEAVAMNHSLFSSYCVLKEGVTAVGPVTAACSSTDPKASKVGCNVTAGAVQPREDCADDVLTTSFQFYGPWSTHKFACPLLPAEKVAAVTKTMYDGLDTLAGRLLYGFFMDKQTMDRTTRYTRKTRSSVILGGPLPGYYTENDEMSAQMKEYQKLLGDATDAAGVERRLFDYFEVQNKPFFSAYRNKFVTPGGVLDVRMYCFPFRQNEFQRVVNTDFLMVIFSIFFVYYWIWRHTGSFFLASAGMFQIFFSLPAAVFFYGVIFRITYFVQIHILAIFLVLGIGADDVFVLVDAWKQSVTIADGLYKPPKRVAAGASKEPLAGAERVEYKRLVYAYNRTYQAVFNTSFTTAVAFLATGISPCMPISSFGYYAAICIVLNYIFAISFLPAVVVLWHRWFERKPHFCDPFTRICCWCGCLELVTGKKKEKLAPEGAGAELAKHEVPFLFSRVYIPGMTVKAFGGFKVVATFVVLACVALFAQGAYFASKLRPPMQQEAFFPDDHMFTRTEDDLSVGFYRGSEEQYTEMKLVWGIDGINRAGFNRWEPDFNRGSAIFNADFDLSPKAAQQAVLDACAAMRTWPCTAGGCTDGSLARDGSTVCFLEQFRSWLTKTHEEDSFVLGEGADGTGGKAAFEKRLLEFQTTEPVLDAAGAPIVGKTWVDVIGFVEGKLAFVVVPFRSTLLVMQPLTVKQAVTTHINLYLDAQRKKAPKGHGLESLFLTGDRFWVWSATEQGLIDGMFRGLYICFPVAFLVLIGATKNILLASYAIFAIGSIVTTVLGFCQSIMGWPLGVGETISGIIVIGFSVDYVVHLGHMVEEAQSRGIATREERFVFAAETMGPTVLAGAVTTGGSAMFMFLCQMTFFYKMAVLICVTIFLSFVFALGFFMAMVYTVGPEGSCGRIPTPWGEKGAANAPPQLPPVAYSKNETALTKDRRRE